MNTTDKDLTLKHHYRVTFEAWFSTVNGEIFSRNYKQSHFYSQKDCFF
jgi:hypothetical protein